MKIAVKCFATLAEFAPEGAESFEVSEGLTVGGLIALLGIGPEEVKIMFVNGTHETPEKVLAEGDRVGLFPAIGGG